QQVMDPPADDLMIVEQEHGDLPAVGACFAHWLPALSCRPTRWRPSKTPPQPQRPVQGPSSQHRRTEVTTGPGMALARRPADRRPLATGLLTTDSPAAGPTGNRPETSRRRGRLATDRPPLPPPGRSG